MAQRFYVPSSVLYLLAEDTTEANAKSPMMKKFKERLKLKDVADDSRGFTTQKMSQRACASRIANTTYRALFDLPMEAYCYVGSVSLVS